MGFSLGLLGSISRININNKLLYVLIRLLYYLLCLTKIVGHNEGLIQYIKMLAYITGCSENIA